MVQYFELIRQKPFGPIHNIVPVKDTHKSTSKEGYVQVFDGNPVQYFTTNQILEVEIPDIPIESIAKLELKEGDILVIKSRYLDTMDVGRIRDSIQKFGNGTRPIGVMCMSPDEDVAVIRQTENEKDPFLP